MSIATLFREVETAFRPKGIQVSETDEAFHIEALVAGVKREEIDISLEKNTLSILAKSEKYSYSYLLPLEIMQIDDASSTEARLEDGILYIKLLKPKTLKPLKITVK